MNHHCVICNKPIEMGDFEEDIDQRRNGECRLVPSHKQCNARWEKHWQGESQFTTDEVAEIEARMDKYPWKPAGLSKDLTLSTSIGDPSSERPDVTVPNSP